MAICDFCNEDMSHKDTATCMATQVTFIEGETYKRIPYSHPTDQRCHDCNVVLGAYHHPGCDMDLCPICGGQIISCGCQGGPDWDVTPFEEEKEEPKSVNLGGGFWPKVKAMNALSLKDGAEPGFSKELEEESEEVKAILQAQLAQMREHLSTKEEATAFHLHADFGSLTEEGEEGEETEWDMAFEQGLSMGKTVERSVLIAELLELNTVSGRWADGKVWEEFSRILPMMTSRGLSPISAWYTVAQTIAQDYEALAARIEALKVPKEST